MTALQIIILVQLVMLIAAAWKLEMLIAERDMWRRIAAREQQAAGEAADDATKWRLSRAARVKRDKTAAQNQQFKVHATTEQLKREISR
jgi:TRAP-type C4-dicarboxylate transport system substrate-binding protein